MRSVRYIATTDDWQRLSYVIEKIRDFGHLSIGSFISVAGGLSFLHLLTAIEPERVVLFDRSEPALDWSRLFRALVLVADTRLELMRFVFGRAFG
ncbi:MAG: hypothetical protein KC620_25945, partial [Myxococcales bacterium]|nr:hypothetical protein [Myxococcales bacterium]